MKRYHARAFGLLSATLLVGSLTLVASTTSGCGSNTSVQRGDPSTGLGGGPPPRRSAGPRAPGDQRPMPVTR